MGRVILEEMKNAQKQRKNHQMVKKRRKKLKKSKINKANKNIKFKEKTAENPKTIKIPKKYQNDVKTNKVSSNELLFSKKEKKIETNIENEESESFKSGYSGHSDFDQLPIENDEKDKNILNDDAKENVSDYDDDATDDDMTRKVMKMMKLKKSKIN